MKILIIQTAFIGDVILATAILEKLHAHFPTAQLDFLVRKGNEGLFVEHPFLNQLLVWDKSNKYSNLYQLAKIIRATGYDKVLNLQRYMLTGLLTACSGAQEKRGFRANPFSWFFHQKYEYPFGTINPNTQQPYHEVERCQQLIADFTDAQPARPRLYPSPADWEKAKSYTAGVGQYVCIAPSSVWATKQLPVEKWVALVAKIIPQQAVLILGGKSDSDLAAQIIQRLQAQQLDTSFVYNTCGKFNLLASAALIAGAQMTYSNDSAPLHLASAMNAPITAFFCSTSPTFGFTPLSDIHIIKETNQALACRPCGMHGRKVCPKGHFACGEISVD